MLLLLTHHWVRDTCVFPTEDQRLRFAAALLFAIFTGCCLAELVDGSRRKAGPQASWDDPDDPDLEGLDCEGQDLKQSEDPDYEKPDPWESLDNSSYIDDDDNGLSNFSKLVRTSKALCYKDVRLWIVQNPKQGGRDLLAIKVTFS
jgi:hypothetical protein